MFKKNVFFLLFVILISLFCISVDAQSLYDTLSSQAILDNQASQYVSSTTGIDFSEVSSDTNGKGLYKISSTMNQSYPILYYRGDIDNNHVIYAGLCWDIIRTTETGGIKVMYAGVANNNTCNNEKEALAIGKHQYNDSNDSPKYGWTYLDNGVEKDSVAKEALDQWYQENMTDYTRELEDTYWCNDRRMAVHDVFDARTRLEEGKPDLSCALEDSYTVSSSKGNGKLTYPTGIINADEATYAGEVLKKTQVNTFVNIGYSYWSMTPYTVTKNMYPNSKGMLNMYTFTYNAGIRPMISFRNTATFNAGDGTANNPYRVEVEKQYHILTDDHLDTSIDESESGKKILVSVQDRDGYLFVDMKVTDLDGNDLNLEITKVGDHYQFVMPDQDVKIQSNYRIVKESFRLSSSQEEILIPHDMVEMDQEAHFSVVPKHGFQLESIALLDDNGDPISISLAQNGNDYTFIMPGENVTVEATFQELPKYTVMGEDIIIDEEEFYSGDTVSFQIKQYPNKQVSSVLFYTKDGEKIDVPYQENNHTYSFSMIDQDVIVKVQYIESIYQNPKTSAMIEKKENHQMFITITLLMILSGVVIFRRERAR